VRTRRQRVASHGSGAICVDDKAGAAIPLDPGGRGAGDLGLLEGGEFGAGSDAGFAQAALVSDGVW
jgi:hypothetical protein